MVYINRELEYIDRDWVRRNAEEIRDYSYNIAMRKVKPDYADDISQIAFIKVFSGIETFSQGRPVFPWIGRITNNTIIDHFRKQRRERRISVKDVDYIREYELVRPEDNLIRNEEFNFLTDGIYSLSEEEREVIESNMKGLSISETADRLKIPSGTVKSRMHRSVSKLKRYCSNFSNL